MTEFPESDSWFTKLKGFLANRGLLRREATYDVGRVDLRFATIETKFSWITRSFFRDRYVYFVSRVQASPDDVYIIERVEQLAYFGKEEHDIPIPDGYSALTDGKHGTQKNALSRSNSGQLGERSALTVYGPWIRSSITLLSGLELEEKELDPYLQAEGGPFAGAEVPDAVRRFNSEQAAYAYLDNINGEKIPARIRHLAWVAIAVSTILWQWHDEIVGLFG